MRLTSVLGNRLRLDGGAMFGNVPRAVWSRWLVPDDQGRIELCCRCLLVEEPGGRRILFDTGVGAFFEPKLKERFGVVESRHVLLDSLGSLGLGQEDIDMVVLSHLHFDHAGGLLSRWRDGERSRLLFPKATYLVSEGAWRRAQQPHPRDRASFVADLPPLLEQSGRLRVFPDAGGAGELLGSGYRCSVSDGHTPAMLVTEIVGHNRGLVLPSDLVPGAAWVHLPVTMGYDRYPERVVDEKSSLLSDAVSRRVWLCFAHDPSIAAGSVARDDRGHFVVGQTRAELVRWSLD
jgi:glyoxylase-like metal-dependent hydrolase (beta-lactamase superfamily II)